MAIIRLGVIDGDRPAESGPLHPRIYGIEIEFGCLVQDAALGSPEQVSELVKDHIFTESRAGVIDLHARDYTFEPARAGGFLLNGGRLYIDVVGDHEEYATPECRTLKELVTQERAGHRLLQGAVEELGLAGCVSFHNNSVDHFGGHTFGCHENYLARLDEEFFRSGVAYLMPFLVTRQLFAGVGRVGGHRLNRSDLRNNVMQIGQHEVDYIWVHNFYGVEIDRTVDFQLSQRADHILKQVGSKVRFNRSIINPKWDSYYTWGDLHRLHVLYGEANMSEWATAMKVGSTCLALSLVEAGVVPDEVLLADPLRALREVSRDPHWKWIVHRMDGSSIGAVDLQRIYLKLAQEHFAGRDEETDWILREWDYALTGLETDPMLLDDRIDWVAKRKLLEMFREAEGASWQDDVMQSLDLAYHDINPESGLYHGLVQQGAMIRLTDDATIDRAKTTPPPDTRASARGAIVKWLLESGHPAYALDWDAIFLSREQFLDLRNPFRTYEREVQVLTGRD